jgi:hypothetical protein
MVIAVLLIFSMRAAGVGPLLFSARLDVMLRLHRCRIKDWRYSQAAMEVCGVFSGVL